MEKQPVGICSSCGKIVHCDGGFLQGIVMPDHTLLCYECEEQQLADEQHEERI